MSGTILLADDSLTIQKVVELTFADTDYRVVAVSSGDELLERLRDSQADLIICDVIMPGRDGYEVCQQIKSSSEWLHLPVILLTGTFEPFDRDRAIAAGCSEIITKPFEARKLVDTVERLIGGTDVVAPQGDPVPAVADESATWPEEATPIEAPAEPEPEAFGTQLSAPEATDDGIEFTTSGFAEMEAAGQDSSTASDAPEDGLDFEFGVPEDAEQGDLNEDPSARTVRIEVPRPDETPDDVAAASAAADTDEVAPEPFSATEEEPFQEPAEVTADEPDDDDAAATFEDEPSMADTSPVDPPEDEHQEPLAAVAEGGVQLSEEDVDRIARRVVELASDRLEQIAWEVVPDMAEIVVRQRIRELEAEAEAAPPDSVQ